MEETSSSQVTVPSALVVSLPAFSKVVQLREMMAKRVVVAFVEVELRAVKFCRVEDPESKRFERVVRPPVAVTVPVKLAADEIVWPLIKPEVIAPSVEFPAVRAVAKRLVEEAVVAKKLVVVAFEEVELSAVKLRSVEEPDISKLESEVRPEVTFKVPVNEAAEEIVWPLIKPEVMAPVVSEPEEVMLPTLRVVAERLVEEAVVAKKLVVVAEVPVAFTKVKFWRVVEEVTMRLVVVAWPAMVRPEEVVPPPMVEEAVTRRLERVVRPAVAVTVPVKLAADEIVCPLIVPEVILPKVALPTLSAVAKRLVEEATEAKKLVVVAFVEVEFIAVKF